MPTVPSLKLNTGASIPAIGIGAFAGIDPDSITKSTAWFVSALKAGYRHIDTAQIYGTEESVGKAIRESGIPREEVFVTTKLPIHHPPYLERSFNESLKNLGLDYVDLYLIHWPQTAVYDSGYDLPKNPADIFANLEFADSPNFHDTWAGLEKIYSSGRAKAIGVSNFSIKTLEELLKTAEVVPAVNQLEVHPYLAQKELLEYCKSKGILVTAYSPTGHEKVRADPTIVALAEKYNVTPAQIILGWHVARGTAAVPKSQDAERQKANINLPTLDAEDVENINGLDRNERTDNAFAEAARRAKGSSGWQD